MENFKNVEKKRFKAQKHNRGQRITEKIFSS